MGEAPVRDLLVLCVRHPPDGRKPHAAEGARHSVRRVTARQATLQAGLPDVAPGGFAAIVRQADVIRCRWVAFWKWGGVDLFAYPRTGPAPGWNSAPSCRYAPGLLRKSRGGDDFPPTGDSGTSETTAVTTDGSTSASRTPWLRRSVLDHFVRGGAWNPVPRFGCCRAQTSAPCPPRQRRRRLHALTAGQCRQARPGGAVRGAGPFASWPVLTSGRAMPAGAPRQGSGCKATGPKHGRLGGSERGLDVFLRMTPARGHSGKATSQARRSRANQRARCQRASRTSGGAARAMREAPTRPSRLD